MNEWAATQRIAATVTFAEGMPIQGDLHVQPRVARHEGSETPLEMLNRPDPFFPMTLPDGKVVFVCKAQVTVVACRADSVPSDPERASVARLIHLEVELQSGAEFRGVSSTELPPNKARASDFLNSPEPFFSLVTEEVTLLINRSQVRLARPVA